MFNRDTSKRWVLQNDISWPLVKGAGSQPVSEWQTVQLLSAYGNIQGVQVTRGQHLSPLLHHIWLGYAVGEPGNISSGRAPVFRFCHSFSSSSCSLWHFTHKRNRPGATFYFPQFYATEGFSLGIFGSVSLHQPDFFFPYPHSPPSVCIISWGLNFIRF